MFKKSKNDSVIKMFIISRGMETLFSFLMKV